MEGESQARSTVPPNSLIEVYKGGKLAGREPLELTQSLLNLQNRDSALFLLIV
jgi:hypothetical protein